MALRVDVDREQLAAQLTPVPTAIVVLGSVALCAMEASSWGTRLFHVAPLPVIVATLPWMALMFYGAWLVAGGRWIHDWIALASVPVQVIMCAAHGAASAEVVSPLYAFVLLSAMSVARLYSPRAWLYVTYLVTTPLLRAALHPRVDDGLLAAAVVAVLATLLFHRVARVERLRHELVSATEAEMAWAAQLRAQPSFEVAMLLHDGVSGALLRLQARLRQAVTTSELSPLIREVLADVHARTMRSRCSDVAALGGVLAAHAERLGVRLSLDLAGSEHYGALPAALRDDLVVIAIEGVSNAARHGDGAVAVYLRLALAPTGATLHITSRRTSRDATAASGQRGLRNLRLRAATWYGSATLENKGADAVLRVDLHHLVRPRWFGTALGLILCAALLLSTAWSAHSWAAFGLALFAVALWLATGNTIYVVLRKTAATRAQALHDRQALEAEHAMHAHLRLGPHLDATEAALAADDLPALRRAIDALATALTDIIADLENARAPP